MNRTGILILAIILLFAPFAEGYISPIEGGTMVTLSNDWDAGESLFIGAESDGNELVVPAPWEVRGDVIIIGGDYLVPSYGSNNRLLLNGSGALLKDAFYVSVGDTGVSNRVEVLSGAHVIAPGFVGYNSSASHNVAMVSGSGSKWSGDYMEVGSYGNMNELLVISGGSIDCANLSIGLNVGANSNMVMVSGVGSVLSNSSELVVGYAGNSGNRLLVEYGGKVVTGNLTIYLGNSVEVHPGCRLEVSTVEGALDMHGIYLPGVGATVASISGGLALHPSSRIEMTVEGLGGLGSDQLVISGPAELDGVLMLELADGFYPEIGDSFNLFDWAGGVFGNFSSFDFPVLPAGASWDTSLLYSSGAVRVVSSGSDLDGDGMDDVWEIAHFIDGTNAQPHAHGDSDMFDNLQEFIAGTDPTNGASYFQVTNWSADAARLEWTSVSSRLYTVWWSTNLLSGFQPLEPAVTYPGNSFTDTVHSANAAGYYKVKVELQ